MYILICITYVLVVFNTYMCVYPHVHICVCVCHVVYSFSKFFCRHYPHLILPIISQKEDVFAFMLYMLWREVMLPET